MIRCHQDSLARSSLRKRRSRGAGAGLLRRRAVLAVSSDQIRLDPDQEQEKKEQGVAAGSLKRKGVPAESSDRIRFGSNTDRTRFKRPGD